jgi:hypothetical protein
MPPRAVRRSWAPPKPLTRRSSTGSRPLIPIHRRRPPRFPLFSSTSRSGRPKSPACRAIPVLRRGLMRDYLSPARGMLHKLPHRHPARVYWQFASQNFVNSLQTIKKHGLSMHEKRIRLSQFASPTAARCHSAGSRHGGLPELAFMARTTTVPALPSRALDPGSVGVCHIEVDQDGPPSEPRSRIGVFPITRILSIGRPLGKALTSMSRPLARPAGLLPAWICANKPLFAGNDSLWLASAGGSRPYHEGLGSSWLQG